MAKQTINIGASPNDGTGTPLRTAFDYTNQNFTELYTATGPSGNNIVVPGNATITGALTVDTSTLVVDSSQDRVAIGFSGNASSGRLQINQPLGSTIDGALRITDNATTSFVFNNVSSGVSGIWSSGAIAFGVGSGTFTEAMRLNSTGLGVGGSPSSRLDVANSGTPVVFSMTLTGAQRWQQIIDTTAGNWTLRDQTGSIDALIVKAGSGNVGIGVTPSAWGSGIKGLDIGAWTSTAQIGAASFYGFNSYASTTGQFNYKNSGAIALGYFQTTSGHLWLNAPSNAGAAGANATFTTVMTLDASGNLLVGTTSALAAWATKLVLSTNSGTTKWAVGPYADPNNFIISASGSFGVYLNGTSAVSWTGISDERLKDIIEPISNAVAKVGQLRSVIGKFKADETNTRRSFLLAQDVQAVLPEAVDASNPDRLGVAYTDVIPLLVAAIKELTARVQTLETR